MVAAINRGIILLKATVKPTANQACLVCQMQLEFIYLGFLRRFQHCTGHITTGCWKGRGNQYIQFVRVLYCKLPTNAKQLPAFPLEVVMEIEPRPQRWEARVFPLCHRGPSNTDRRDSYNFKYLLDFFYFFELLSALGSNTKT